MRDQSGAAPKGAGLDHHFTLEVRVRSDDVDPRETRELARDAIAGIKMTYSRLLGINERDVSIRSSETHPLQTV